MFPFIFIITERGVSTARMPNIHPAIWVARLAPNAATLLAAADMILEQFDVLCRVVDPSSYAQYTRWVGTVRARRAIVRTRVGSRSRNDTGAGDCACVRG
jgi:hypothetical protein